MPDRTVCLSLFDSADAIEGAWDFFGDGDIERVSGGYGSNVSPVNEVVAAFEDDWSRAVSDGEGDAAGLELGEQAREVEGVLVEGKDEVAGGTAITGDADAVFGAGDGVEDQGAGLAAG